MSFLVAVMATVFVKAQDVQLVTLQHGDDMQAFYGPDGLKNAVAAAQQGDVLSLSGGTFNATTIDKAITIQGAGYIQDTNSNRYRTMIVGEMTIDLPAGQSGLLIEGIHTDNNINIDGTCTGMSFQRCLINSDLTVKCESNNLMFLHCRVKNLNLTGISHAACIKNSAVDVLGGSDDVSESGLVENCVIRCCKDNVKTFVFRNNILYREGSSPYSTSSSLSNSYYYNLYNRWVRTISSSCQQEGNYTFYGYESNFLKETFGDYSKNFLDSPYTLTDYAKKYIGTDGTEVGIHGGSQPFTDVPSTPQITQKTIATQTDANGKLSVKIVVEAQK